MCMEASLFKFIFLPFLSKKVTTFQLSGIYISINNAQITFHAIKHKNKYMVILSDFLIKQMNFKDLRIYVKCTEVVVSAE